MHQVPNLIFQIPVKFMVSPNSPFSSEDALRLLAFGPIFLLDPVFSLFYTLPMKRKFLSKIDQSVRLTSLAE